MKILFLCTYYHRAMIFRNSMDWLSQLGHEVKAFNAVTKKEKVDKKYRSIMDDAVIHKECFNKWDRYIYQLKQRKIYKALIANCEVEKYDLIHSHNLFNGGYVAYYIKKHFRVPYIVSVRNTDINTFLRIPLFVNIANRIIKDAAGVHFLSKPYKEKFIDKYVKDDLKNSIKNKSIIIGIGLEEFWLKNKVEVKRLNNNKSIKILCVAKIDRNKNITTTIKAINILIAKGYNVEFTIVGQVKDDNILKKIQKVKFIKVIQYLTKEKLIDVYRKNDIYIMPSISESFGRVYAEAMTQGLPVIYTQGQGFDGIYEDGYIGYSVPYNNAKYIAECVLKILDNYFQISARCIEHSSEFGWNSISKKLNKFYVESLERELNK